MGFMRDGEGGTPRRLSVDGPPYDDCSEKDVVRVVELDVRDTDVDGEPRVGLGGGSYRTDEYLTEDCCSTHSAVRSCFWICLCGVFSMGRFRRLC